MKRKLFSHDWDFTLYEVDKRKVISVVFYNSFIDTSHSFYLEGEENNYDLEKLIALADRIRNNYNDYKDREIISPF